jgi:hypothetical protein
MLQFSKRVLDRLGFQYFNRSLIFVLVDLEKLPIAPKKPYSFRLATKANRTWSSKCILKLPRDRSTGMDAATRTRGRKSP